jgi:hypothetical protein
MTRFPTALLALALAAPAMAGTYTATPTAVPETTKVVARDIAWKYAGGVFTGRTDESRPMVLCQGLAKRAGRLDTFAVDGKAFSADDLAKCNSFAKAVPTALAKAD